MSTLLFHVYIFAGIYAVVSALIFIHLFRLSIRYKINKVVDHWFRILVVDALSWPYDVLRYGLEEYIKEIR